MAGWLGLGLDIGLAPQDDGEAVGISTSQPSARMR
jgi:hypothetical protein